MVSSIIRQKGESQNGCFKKTKLAKFSGKQTFLTPGYAYELTYWLDQFGSHMIKSAKLKKSL